MSYKSDDEQLEGRLKKLPKQKDNRSKDEVLKRLKQDDRIKDTSEHPSPKKRRFPPFLIAAAIVLLAILIPTLVNFSNANQTTEETESKTTSDKAMKSTEKDSATTSEESEEAEAVFLDEESSQYALYPRVAEGSRVLHIGLQNPQAISIPFSIVLTKEQLEDRELTADATELELYQAFAKEIDEQSLGYEEFHPFLGSLTEDDQQLSIRLDDSHHYDQSAATQEVFLTSLMQTFTSYQEIRILDMKGKPAEFDLVGELETIELAGEQAHTPYFEFTQDDGKILLSPNFMQQADSFEEALRLMQTSPNDFFSSVIPEELNFTVSTEGQTAEVLFTDGISLNEMENMNANQFIDAVALTASSFGLSVKLTNVEPVKWNGLDFNIPLPKTLGANPIHITF